MSTKFATGTVADISVQIGRNLREINNGQCGLCTHFGERRKTDVLVSIMNAHQADLKVIDECGHPKHAALHLKVTPISGCDGFVPAAAA